VHSCVLCVRSDGSRGTCLVRWVACTQYTAREVSVHVLACSRSYCLSPWGSSNDLYFVAYAYFSTSFRNVLALGAPRPPNPLKPKPLIRLARRGLPSTIRRISSLDQAKLCDGVLSRVHSPLGELLCLLSVQMTGAWQVRRCVCSAHPPFPQMQVQAMAAGVTPHSTSG
jgi:hypothetical protein